MRTFYFDFHVSDAYVFGQSPTERGCMRQAAGIAGRKSAGRFTSALEMIEDVDPTLYRADITSVVLQVLSMPNPGVRWHRCRATEPAVFHPLVLLHGQNLQNDARDVSTIQSGVDILNHFQG